MPGGALQLVLSGYAETFLISNPQITYFKQVYKNIDHNFNKILLNKLLIYYLNKYFSNRFVLNKFVFLRRRFLIFE
jgi:hypothetical protein